MVQVFDSGALSGPFTCGSVPVKSKRSRSACDVEPHPDADRPVEIDAVVVHEVFERVAAAPHGGDLGLAPSAR